MATRKKWMKTATDWSRIIVGATFLFSGFVKAVDPMGFAYKIQDYLIALYLPSLFAWALPVAIAAITLEFLVGVSLLLGICRKFAAISAALFMTFFLPFTFWVALKNPVKDCGCFGDAFVIGNWATFYKNMGLSICTVVLLLNYRNVHSFFSKKTKGIAAVFVFAYIFSFAIYNTLLLPVFDFRPYKIGTDIREQIRIDPSKGDVVENILVYEKEGVKQEFTEENYPWSDSTWTFVDMRTRVIREGKNPEIEDFQISSVPFDSLSQRFVIGEDITELILSDTQPLFLMVSQSLREMNTRYLNRFRETARFALNNRYAFYLVTSSSPEEIERWSKRNNFEGHFALADERVLKTMIRSNPGLMLLQNGNVINKWADRRIPGFQSKGFPEQWEGRNFGSKLLIILALFFVPLLLIKVLDKVRVPIRCRKTTV